MKYLKLILLNSLVFISFSINGQVFQAPNGNVVKSTEQPNFKLDVRKPISLADLNGNLKNDVVQLRLSVTDGFVPDNAESRLLFSVQQWNEGANFNYGAIGSAKANGENYGRLAFYTNVGSSNGTPLGLAERMRIDFNGCIGIGTAKPTSLLDVRGAASVNVINNNKVFDLIKLRLSATDGFVPVNSEARMLFSIQQWDEGAAFNFGAISAAKENDENYGRLVFYTSKGTSGTGECHLEEQMRISNNGNVGIGVTNPGTKLDVAGTIRAHEVKVCLNQGCDFVFDKTYKLLSIQELDNFIKLNKHLPDIAPAAKMENEGINLSEMNAKLLQKIEEQSLYIIELNKRLSELEKQMNELKK